MDGPKKITTWTLGLIFFMGWAGLVWADKQSKRRQRAGLLSPSLYGLSLAGLALRLKEPRLPLTSPLLARPSVRTARDSVKMPSRSPRRSARAPLPTAAEPPPGLFPAREDLVRLLAVISIAAAAAAACSVLNRRPEHFCDSPQSPDDYADGTAISFYSFLHSSPCSPC